MGKKSIERMKICMYLSMLLFGSEVNIPVDKVKYLGFMGVEEFAVVWSHRQTDRLLGIFVEIILTTYPKACSSAPSLL